MSKQLHIISFAVPYPVAHGGLFDLYYKLIAFHQAGVEIHLHCFTDGKNHAQELEKYCASVNYYPRKKGWRGLSFNLPYIVSSRKSTSLKKALMRDNYPLLFEGIHSTYLLNDPAFVLRKTMLRLHNVEHEYYRSLYKYTASIFRRMYYLLESRMLKEYETRIAHKPSFILTVSRSDKERYESKFHLNNIEFLPVFAGFEQVNILPGTGCFCLYHGNLSVVENEKAALWLMHNVFNELNVPLVVAGRNPSPILVEEASRQKNLSLVANPSSDEINDLIRKAQCHVLPSFNSTGVKLKLINALYNGRHCIVNTAAVSGTGMESLCHIADSEEEFKTAILTLFPQPARQTDIENRTMILQQLFNSQKNVERLIRKLW